MLMLQSDFFQMNFFKKFFQEHYQCHPLGSRSGPTFWFCQSLSGSKLFAKIISRQQKLPLAGKDLKFVDQWKLKTKCGAFHQCFHRLPRQTQSSVAEIQYHFETKMCPADTDKIITCTPSLYNRHQDKYVTENYFFLLFTLSYFSTKTYVVGTQKNRHNVTALLSTKNMCF